MCGARSRLVGAFAEQYADLQSAEGRKSSRARYANEPRGRMKNAHGVERFVRQGANGANLSLYEVNVVFEEYG